MKKKRDILFFALIATFVAISSVYAITRSIYIWDAAAPGANFQHPDSSSTFIIRPRDGWLEAINAIQADEGGDIYGMRDTLLYSYGTDWPSDLNPFSIVIISMGWIDGSGPDDIDAAKQAQIIAYLDATGRTPGSQTAVVLEGNDFAKLYCDTSASHYTYAGTFADYTGALLLVDDGGAPDMLVGEDSSFADGMSFDYHPTEGATSSVDDIIINDAVWDSHHLRYVFNASSKCPARGIQRRSYSPGAMVTLPFQFGNIPRGGNSKEELCARLLDFCVMPLTDITTALSGDTLFMDSVFTIGFDTYDNRCVILAEIEYTTDAGATWHMVNQVSYPTEHEDFEFNLPHTHGGECYFRITVHDSVFNSTADTSESFVLLDPTLVDDKILRPDEISITTYPNPFNGEVSIRARAPFDSEVQIYNIYGSMLVRIPSVAPECEVIWNASAEPVGIYFARIANSCARTKLVFIK
ncbi:hypothetical protein KAH81_06225 [bacterium]|nr:hypothetical protein [bacterium]